MNREISFHQVTLSEEITTSPHTPWYEFMYSYEDESTDFPDKTNSTNQQKCTRSGWQIRVPKRFTL